MSSGWQAVAKAASAQASVGERSAGGWRQVARTLADKAGAGVDGGLGGRSGGWATIARQMSVLNEVLDEEMHEDCKIGKHRAGQELEEDLFGDRDDLAERPPAPADVHEVAIAADDGPEDRLALRGAAGHGVALAAQALCLPIVEEGVLRQLAGMSFAALGKPLLADQVSQALAFAKALPTGAIESCLHQPTLRVAKEYLETNPMVVGTLAAKSEKLGVDARRLAELLRLSAAALVQTERLRRYIVETHFAGHYSQAQRLLYLDAVSFDETPLPVVTPHFIPPCEVRSRAEQPNFIVRAPGSMPRLPDLSLDGYEKSPTVAKLMQVEVRYGMLVKVLGGQGGGQTHVMLLGDTVTFLQHMETNSAKCIFGSLLRANAVSEHAGKFQLQWRVASTDDAGGNDLAERYMQSARPDTWRRLRFPCEVHKVATAQTMVFSLMEETVRGMLNVALAVKDSWTVLRFRETLRAAILARVRICNGVLPRAALLWKMRILKMCLCSGKHRNFRATILNKLPNGDWRNTTCVEYYPEPGENLDEVPRKLADGMCLALFGSKITVWPRHRWRGADLACSQILLLDACHGLLRVVFPLFCKACRARESVAQDAPAEAAGMAPPGPRAISSTVDGPVDGSEGQAGHGEESCAGMGTSARSAREENEQHRRAALQFVASCPTWTLIVCRWVLEPFRQLMDSKLVLGSERWEKFQQARAAQVAMDSHGSDEGHSVSARSFRALESAKNTLETRFFHKLEALDSPVMWEVMPLSDCTERAESLVFRMLSKAGCVVMRLLAHPHTKFPFRTLRCLDDIAVAEELRTCPPCMMDPCSKQFVDHFRESLDGDDARMCLVTLLSLAYTDTVRIEVNHANIRRLVKSRVQCSGLTVSDASAAWCLGKVRTKLPLQKQRHVRRVRLSGTEEKECEEPPKKKHRRGCGGAWRLFCRREMSCKAGQVADWQVCGEKYRALPRGKKEELQTDARFLRMRHDLMGSNPVESTFGPKASVSARKARAFAAARRLDLRLRGLDEDEAQEVIVERALATLPPACTLKDVKKAATRSERWRRGWRAREEEAWQRTEDAWVVDHGKPMLDCLKGEMPEARDALSNAKVHAGPFPGVLVVEDVAQGSEAGRLAALLAGDKYKTHSNLRSTLDSDWSLKHSQVRESEVEIVEDRQALVHKCQALGRCVCSLDGRRLHQCMMRFNAALKVQFPYTGTSRKELLQGGRIFARLQGVPATAGDGATEMDMISHIGSMSLSPFEPTFRVVQLTDERPEDGIISIKGIGEYLVEVVFFEKLDLNLQWMVRFYRIQESLRPRMPFRPDTATAKLLDGQDVGGRPFWPPPARKHAPRRGAAMVQVGVFGDPLLADLAAEDDRAEELEGADDLREEGGLEGRELAEALADFENEISLARTASSVAPNDGGSPSSSGDDSSSSTSSSDSESSSSSEANEGGGELEDPSSDEGEPIERKRDVTFVTDAGVLRWYAHGQMFTATCPNPDHGRCILTRSSKPNSSKRFEAQGRPLGLLTAWLKGSGCATREMHWCKDLWGDHETRSTCRADLANQPLGRRLLRRERPRRVGEPDEPFGLS